MGWFDRFWRREAVAAPVAPPQRDHEQYLYEMKRTLAQHREAFRNLLDQDEGEWQQAQRYTPNEVDSSNIFQKVAEWRLMGEFPCATRARKLYKQLVFSPGFTLGVKRVKGEKKDSDKELFQQVSREYQRTIAANIDSWSPEEAVDRTMRDGDCFNTYTGTRNEYLSVGFIDSEEIYDKDNKSGKDSKGIITDEKDVTKVLKYLRYRTPDSKVEELKPEQIVHLKCDVDSTVKRGRSRFDGLQRRLAQIEEFTDTEYMHRRMQASLVIHRKVTGSRQNTSLVLDNAHAGSDSCGDTAMPIERMRPGMVVTTNGAVDLEFKSPDSTFSDATGIGRMLTRVVSQKTGFTYEMLSADVSEGNLASTEINEAPVKDMIAAERDWFVKRLMPIFRKMVETGQAAKRIEQFDPEEFEIIPVFAPPQPKDLLKVAQAANAGVMGKFISRTEASRMMNKDPDQMQGELEEEYDKEHLLPDANNPSLQAKADSAAGNAAAGGTNQGENKPISHSDNKSSGKT